MSILPLPDLSEPVLAGPAPRGLGKLMVGGTRSVVERRGNDFYPTPPEATRALLRAEGDAIRAHGAPVWEPCGRGGAICRELSAAGFPVLASDIVADPEHAVVQQDLLLAERALSPIVVTNPPFALAGPMIRHLLDGLGVDYLALLLKSTFWAAGKRTALLSRWPVARRYDLNWRLDFTDGGNPTMECSWFVWDSRAPRVMTWNVLDRAAPAHTLFDEKETDDA